MHNGSLNALGLFEEQLNQAYRSYFLGELSEGERRAKNRELDLLPIYEKYLSCMCLLYQREVPHLFLTLWTAQEMMSEPFTRAITNSFMDYPWASPEDHPDCAILGPAVGSMSGANFRILVNWANGGHGPIPGNSVPTWARSYDQKLQHGGITLKKLKGLLNPFLMKHSWFPWDCLVSTLCGRAMELSYSEQRLERVQEFSGSLRGGIHMKSTLRSLAKGSERIYVRDFIRKCMPGRISPEGFPVVWLMDLEEDKESEWNVLHFPFSFLQCYVRDQHRFKSIRSSQGDCMVAAIGYSGKDVQLTPRMVEADISVNTYKGMLFFQPMHWSNDQVAYWAEVTGYRRNPVCRNPSLRRESDHLRRLYKRQHGIDLESHHWATALIMLAVPFAKRSLIVIAPTGFQIQRAVHEKAAEYGVKLSAVSLEHFNPSDVEKLASCYMVPAISHDPNCVYPREAIDAIGEEPGANLDQVQRELLEFATQLFLDSIAVLRGTRDDEKSKACQGFNFEGAHSTNDLWLGKGRRS